MRENASPSTLAFYEANAEAYLGARPDEVTPALVPFLDRLPRGARILELGCGGGSDAEYMLSRGFAVVPTDGSPTMAAVAARRLNRPVATLRFDQLDEEQSFDAVVACAALLHVPKGQLGPVIQRIWRALKPGGWHFASFKTGETEGLDAHGRHYNQVTPAELDAVYAAAGDWASLVQEETMGVGHFSTPSRWLHLTARRKA